MIEAFFIRYAAQLVPARFQRAVAWLLAAVTFFAAIAAVIAVTVGGAKIYLALRDMKTIEKHEERRETAASAGREKSAEEAVVDAFTNLRERDERDRAIAVAEASEAAKPPEAQATIPPTTLARRCRQFRQAYTADQLAKMPEFKEKCS